MMQRSTKPALLLAALLAVAMAPAAARASTCDAEAPDSAAIRALWAELDARWNERDAAGFAQLFDDAATFEFVDRDERIDGRAAVLAYFTERFPGFAPDLRHVTTVHRVTQPAPGVQLVDGAVEIVRVADPAAGDAASPTTLLTFSITALMVPGDGDGAWRIAALRVFQRAP